MSGYKRALVTISEAVYRRMHEEDMQSRFRGIPSHTAAFEPARLEAIERMLSKFSERQEDFQGCIASLGSDIGQVEACSVQALRENSDASLQKLMKTTENTLQRMEGEKNTFQRQMRDEKDAIQRQMHKEKDGLQRQILKDKDALQKQMVKDKDTLQRQMLDEKFAIQRQIEKEKDTFQRRILKDEESFHQKMMSGLQAARNDTVQVMQEYAEQLNEQIEAVCQQQASQLAGLQNQYLDYSDEKEQKEIMARTWLESAWALREFIEKEYDHQRFLPGGFDAVDIRLQQAEDNLANAMPEAALVLAQQAYTDSSIKRLELEKLTIQWQAIYMNALQRADELFADVLACRSLPAIGMSGEELEINLDLNKWSDEEFSAIKKDALSLRSELRRGARELDTRELNTILSTRIPKVRQNLIDLVYKARWEVVNSQIRINIAEIAIQALEGQGFQLNEHGFRGNNMKGAYQIALVNVEGSQVFIQLNPLADMEASTDLSIESMDQEKRTPSELRSRSTEITRSLARFGLRVGPVSVGKEIQEVGKAITPLPKSVPEKPVRLSLKDHGRTT